MCNIIDGKLVSEIIKKQIKSEVDELSVKCDLSPKLAVILAGDDPASQTYVNNKINSCSNNGIESSVIYFDSNVGQEELLETIKKLNENPKINGILVQLPLPKHINEYTIIEAISPLKDVDGFHPENVGRLWIGQNKGLLPCTPFGIIELLNYYKIDVKGKNVVIIGRSNIVGKPLSALLLRKEYNATVTICHSHTKNIISHTKSADILISAIGSPKFIKKEMLKTGIVVIDVGINRIECSENVKGYKICGDVDYEDVFQIASWITPVPGGVGPMTIAMLLKNTLSAFKIQNNIK